ncbi:MAG: PD40 domain-containing protein, partial [Acidobacteria bacterium]|nr:PD40 domain-containing protein [Acidobacteriota bacterium]
MKRCPQCGREYDLSMSFCLDDGNELLYGPGVSDGPATAVMSELPGLDRPTRQKTTGEDHGGQFAESATRPQVHTITAEAEHQNSLGGPSEKRSFSANRAAKPLAVLAAFIVVTAIGFAIYLIVRKKDSMALSFESMKITKLTDTGKAGNAVISPDGKYVVHLKEDAGQRSVWVRHIATGSNVQIIPPSDLVYGRMTFTPDGDYIYFSRWKNGDDNWPLFQVPVLGG